MQIFMQNLGVQFLYIFTAVRLTFSHAL